MDLEKLLEQELKYQEKLKKIQTEKTEIENKISVKITETLKDKYPEIYTEIRNSVIESIKNKKKGVVEND